MHLACVEMNDCLISLKKIASQKVGQVAVSEMMIPAVFKSTVEENVQYVEITVGHWPFSNSNKPNLLR